MNISIYLRENAVKFPDKPALLHPARVTYKELDQEVDRLSHYLEGKGIKPGTRTVLMVPAGPELLYLVFSLLRISAVPVLIDPGMGIRAMLDALRGIRAEAFVGILKAHILRFIDHSVFRELKVKVIVGLPRFLRPIALVRRQSAAKGAYPVSTAGSDDTAAIFFTSGSTGLAKGVVYTTGMLNHQIAITRDHFGISSGEIDLCTFPLLGLFAICHGNSSVFADMDMSYPAKLDPARVVKNIQDFSCTQMFGSPMILSRLSAYCIKNGIKLGSLRHVISAGAPVHGSVLEDFSRIVPESTAIRTPYGATEALPVTDIRSTELKSHWTEKPVEDNGICIGYPVRGIDIRVIEITDEPFSKWIEDLCLPVNQVGEIAVKGSWVSTEYFNNPLANRMSKIADPAKSEIWHRMGDLGRLDGEGRLWFYGRKSQRVVTQSGTLFTIPCEAVFNRHPLVLRSALIGLTDENSQWKQPVICIQLKAGISPSESMKRELLEIAGSSVITREIKECFFFREFPMDPRHNAKIYREKLTVMVSRKTR
ncbi:MAG: fatty acid CoA ligase family protein [Bacteroidales bacterium]|nr:fatty acid CoA ligase family protein [Bacteroidales bacterium]